MAGLAALLGAQTGKDWQSVFPVDKKSPGVKGSNRISRYSRMPVVVPGRQGHRYQEQAPGLGMDRVEIVSESETVATPAGTFRNCIHAAETAPLEKGITDRKWYGAGAGPVKDAGMVLVKYGNF